MSISYLKIVAAMLFLIVGQAHAQLPAFLGAEGYGRMAQGGRGGSVIEVTNLSDAGPGSLRAALDANGPRTIVFRTGGVIDLHSELQIHNPFVTIAAQTAPGDGIVLRNFGLSIFTHDVIIRGLRIRPADGLHTLSPENRDCLSLQNGAYNIMVDHCSFSWAIDENVNLWTGSHHASIQWCVISEALYKSVHPKGPHSMGMLVGDGSHSVSVHHNLFAHNNDRNPLFVGGTDLEFINNLVFDWGHGGSYHEGGAQIRADIVGNTWIPFTGVIDLDELPISIDFDIDNNLGSLLHISGNTWPGGPFLTQQQIASFGANGALFPSSSVLSDASTVTADEVTEIRTAVPAWAGAIHPQRDATDLRVWQQLADSTGGLLDCVRSGPIALDSGTVISANLNSITYSLLDDAIKYSPEGRRIQITSGTGAGQIRTGLDMTVVDELNQVITSNVDAAWQEAPDATSQFRISAYCLNTLNGYPVYVNGQPYTDNDHDGMPDDWELAQGLNPEDASDRNGTDLSEENYTNLEVFLNGYYTDTPLTVDEPLDEAGLSIQPNPFSDATIIQLLGNGHSSAVAEIFSTDGRLVTDLDSNGNGQFMWNGTDTQGRLMPNGLYIVRIATPSENATGRLVLIR